MNDTPKTDIRGNWPGKPKRNAKPPREPVPLEKLAITNDPPPLRKSTPGGHYDALFRELKFGQRIVCPPDRAHGLANTLKDWLAKHGIQATVRSCERYSKDGMGGVWMLPESTEKTTKSTGKTS